MRGIPTCNEELRKCNRVHFFGSIPGFYEGILWKKGKEKGQFQRRKFVLSEKEFTLAYYNKEDVSVRSLTCWVALLHGQVSKLFMVTYLESVTTER